MGSSITTISSLMGHSELHAYPGEKSVRGAPLTDVKAIRKRIAFPLHLYTHRGILKKYNYMNHDYNKEALELHAKGHGKIGTETKVPLETREDLSRAYTPGVAEVCREIARDPLLAREYTLKRNTVAIISDGSAILGLGNLGAYLGWLAG